MSPHALLLACLFPAMFCAFAIGAVVSARAGDSGAVGV